MHTPRVEFISIREKGPCLQSLDLINLYKHWGLLTTYIVNVDMVFRFSLLGTYIWFERCFDL